MTPRKLHKLLGFALLLPFVAWSATGLFFLLRPAYAEAYASLELRLYPLPATLTLAPQPQWQELRYLHTVLGPHLLVRDTQGWTQLDPDTLQPRPQPGADAVQRLVEDAMQHSPDPERFGRLLQVEGPQLRTDTGVEIELDWASLSLTQRGNDTRWIERLYDIHYLRWTGIAAVDKVFGVSGLLLLMLMTWTGARLLLGRGRSPAPRRSAIAAAEQGAC